MYMNYTSKKFLFKRNKEPKAQSFKQSVKGMVK